MITHKNLKLYWARSGPNSIFGQNWQERKKMDEIDAELHFDEVMSDILEEAITRAPVLDAENALELVHSEKQREFFSSDQEHRLVKLRGATLLVQIDSNHGTLTQMWLVNNPALVPGRVHNPRPPAETTGPDILARARRKAKLEKMGRKELAEIIVDATSVLAVK